MKKSNSFLLVYFFLLFCCFARPCAADTLDVILQSSRHDSVKILSVISLVKEYNSTEQFSETVRSGEKALAYLKNFRDIKKTSVLVVSVAIAYYYLGDLPKALEYYLKGLRMREEMNDTIGQGSLLNNIGLAYQDLGNFEMARMYLFRGLEKRQLVGDSLAIAKSLNNIGLFFYARESGAGPEMKESLFDSAMFFFNQSLVIARNLKAQSDVSYTISNIGNVLKDRGKKKEALKHYEQSLKIQVKMDDKYNVAVSNIQIGDLYTETGEFEKAIIHYSEALKVSEELGLLENMKICYRSLSALYEKMGKTKLAFEMFKEFSMLKDSMINTESNRQIAELQTIYDTEKKDAEIKLLNKDKEVIEADQKKQRTFLYSMIFVFILVVLFSVFIFRGYKQKKLANLQLEKKNIEINIQKKEIEERNSEMLSSIRYAKRIQDAMLKEEKKVTDYLPDHFVLFKPKDIVSGDFYWAVEKGDRWFVAAADCTGHGVPGAFLTLLGISFLNEIMMAPGLFSPAEILDRLRERILVELSSQGGKEGEGKDELQPGASVKDGMDISLLSLNLKTLEAEWAGANNALYLVRSNFSGENTGQKISETGFFLTEIKADKQPIGYFPHPHPFTNHKIQLHHGDSVYIFSDGYADQFGGPNGKKFKYSQFEKLLASTQDKSMAEQKEILHSEMERWKSWPAHDGSPRIHEQVDDICVIGIRV